MAPSAEFAGPFWLGFAQETNGIATGNWLIPQDRSHRISSYSYSMAVGTAAMPIGIEENATTDGS
jgi:hypothetical protein